MLKKIGVSAIHSNKADDILSASKLLLPGVGAFDHGINNLRELGLIEILNEAVLVKKKQILGICLGMQLLLEGSEEGILPGLGWIKGKSIRFQFENHQTDLKIPHMGWNEVSFHPNQAVKQQNDERMRFYFVHSYHAVCQDQNNVLGTAYHGYDFPAIVGKDNILGFQFHPEKSHKFGMNLLKQFIAW